MLTQCSPNAHRPVRATNHRRVPLLVLRNTPSRHGAVKIAAPGSYLEHLGEWSEVPRAAGWAGLGGWVELRCCTAGHLGFVLGQPCRGASWRLRINPPRLFCRAREAGARDLRQRGAASVLCT